jgi:hypothetical protein
MNSKRFGQIFMPANRRPGGYCHRRGVCALPLGDAAIPDLERVVGQEADYDFHRAAGLLAILFSVRALKPERAQMKASGPAIAVFLGGGRTRRDQLVVGRRQMQQTAGAGHRFCASTKGTGVFAAKRFF